MIGKSISQFTGDSDKGIRWWFTQLDRGIRKRKKELRVWESNEDYANGKQWVNIDEDGVETSDQVRVNKLRSYMNTHRASVAFKNPRAKVTPRNPAGYAPIPMPLVGPDGGPQFDEMGQVITRDVVPATARGNLINDIISQPLFGLSETMDRFDMSAILAYAVGQVGYRPIFETDPEPDTEQKIPLNEDGSLDISQYEPDPLNPNVPMRGKDGRLIKKSSLPVWEEWFIDCISYKNVIIDPDGEEDFMQHRWVAVEQVRYLDDVKADPLFENTKDLQSTGEYDDDETRQRYDQWLEGEDQEDKAKLVRLFHVYDFVNDRYLVLADGHGKALRDSETPNGITHSNLAFLRYQLKPGEFYPHPKANDLVPINDLYNEGRRLELIGMKHSLRKVIIDEGEFDDDELEKLTSDVDMEVIRRKRARSFNGPPVGVFQPPPVSGDIYRASAAAAADFNEMAGSPEARGQAASNTATQSNNLQAGEDARNTFERSKFRDFLIVLLKKLNDSIDANMSVERAVQISGSDGQAFSVLVDKDLISGDFDIEIDIQEMAPSNNGAQAAQRAQLLQMAGSYPHQFSDPVRTRGWCELFNIYDENFINSIVEGAQIQIQMMMAEMQAKSPEADAPENEAQAASQTGAGQQVPNMQGAR